MAPRKKAEPAAPPVHAQHPAVAAVLDDVDLLRLILKVILDEPYATIDQTPKTERVLFMNFKVQNAIAALAEKPTEAHIQLPYYASFRAVRWANEMTCSALTSLFGVCKTWEGVLDVLLHSGAEPIMSPAELKRVKYHARTCELPAEMLPRRPVVRGKWSFPEVGPIYEELMDMHGDFLDALNDVLGSYVSDEDHLTIFWPDTRAELLLSYESRNRSREAVAEAGKALANFDKVAVESYRMLLVIKAVEARAKTVLRSRRARNASIWGEKSCPGSIADAAWHVHQLNAHEASYKACCRTITGRNGAPGQITHESGGEKPPTHILDKAAQLFPYELRRETNFSCTDRATAHGELADELAAVGAELAAADVDEFHHTQLCANFRARPSDIAVALAYDARDCLDPDGAVPSDYFDGSDGGSDFGGIVCG